MVRTVCRAIRAGARVFARREIVMKLNNKNNAEKMRIGNVKKRSKVIR